MVWPTGMAGLGGPGSFAAKTRTTATSTIVTVDDGVIRVDATGGSRLVTLPAPADAFASLSGVGSIFTVKKIDAAASGVVVEASGGALIDGFPNADLNTQYESIAVQSNGTSYDVLFRNT